MKQYDYLLASLNNPDFTSGDFKDVAGMNLANTQFASKDLYKSNPKIRSQKIFQDAEGNFSDQKFDQYYNNVASSFRDFSTESAVDDYEYSIWDTRRPTGAKIKSINFNLNTVNNPDHIRIGVGGINKITNSDKSRRELAQNSKIFDPATGTFLDKSVNDISLFTNPFEYISSLFDDPLVYATYDEDTIEVDPITGNKVKHQKGEWKVNEDGEYYTEKANGRNLRGKTVLSAADYLTSENSAINKYDFFDSDDLEKSVAGTVAKNVASIIPMFIPYVNTAYSGLLVGRELAKTLPMAYGMISSLTGDDNPNSQLANTIAAYGQKFSTSTSDYAQENTFSFENFGNLMSDVALQWGQQKFIANTFNKLRGGGDAAFNTAAAKAQKTYIDNANKYIQQNLEGKLSKAQLSSYLGTDDPYNFGKLLESGKWAETSLGKAALNKYIPAAEKVMQNRNRLAQDLSLGYMALISNTDVYESVLEKGGTPAEAAAIAFGSTLGMYSVDKYLGLGEMFFEKDPARLALRKAAKENADLYMTGRREAADLSTKKGIIGVIQKGIDLGKRTVDKFGEKYKDGTIGIIGKALGEGAEEVSEELVTDLTKYLGELAGRLGYFSQTDYGAWEDMGDRYWMSFFGGAAGGAMFGGVEAWNNRNNSTKEFQNEITYLLRQGKKKDILQELQTLRDKGSLGSSELSYDSTTNSDGTKTYITADEDHKSQAQTNYEGLSNIINQLDLILNGNQLNLSEDELFDKMVQGEYRANALSDFLKEDKVENVKNISYISRFQQDFQDLTDAIIKTDSAIQDLVNNTTDEAKRKSPEYQEKLEKLQQKKQELIEQKDYLFGEGSLGYVEKTLFAMDTNLSGRFLSLNFNQFARELTGKSLQQLSPSELQTVQTRYEAWKKNGKQDLDVAFKLYKDMEKQVLPELQTLQNTNFDQELSVIEKLRKNDPSKKLLQVTDKLDSESDEEFAALASPLEGESEEDFRARQKKHADAIRKYNIDNQFRWIQEFAKQPITSTDFRYFVSQIGALRGELLKYYLDNVAEQTNADVKKHWWEMQVTPKEGQEIDPNDISDVDKQNTDLYNLILKMGIQDIPSLKKAIKDRINKTASSIVKRKYESVGALLSDLTFTKSLELASNLSTDEKEALNIPIDYEFDNEDEVTYRDIDAFIKYDMAKNGNSLEDEWDYLGLSLDNLEPLQKFYAEATTNPSLLESEEANTIVDISQGKYNEMVNEISDQMSNSYFKNLDTFVEGVNNSPQTRTLNALEGTTFVNNPVIPLLNKISKFSPNSSVNVEDLLQDIYNSYNSQETNADFQLSDSQLSSLKQILKDFKTAESFIYGASVRITDGTPIGHNKYVNEFIKNHSDVFGKAEELPEIKEEDANMLLGEISAYRREINSWINKHDQNTGQREIKFIKANQALTKSIRTFFELNRNAFKISPTLDLLDGYEDLTLDDSLSSIVALQELLYNNRKKSKVSISEILDKLSNSIFDANQVLGQESAKLDENLTYDKLTNYDKFQLIVGAMSASTVKYYKGLKTFLDENPNMAPISMQEYVSKLAYAQKENPKAIDEALDWIKTKTGSKMDVAHNTSIVTGLGGSGKTFAVARLNLGTGKNTWVSGPTQSQVNTLNNSLPDSTEKLKSDLFNTIFGGKAPNIKDLYTTQRENGNIIVNLKDNLNVKKIDNAPKQLVIDEVTHFSTPELLIISKFCDLNGINLILIGDEHQNGYYKNNIGNIEENSLIAWRSPSLYLSLRNGNALKVSNQQPLLSVIDKLSVSDPGTFGNTVYEQIFKNIQLRYYNKDVFSGEMIIDAIPQDVLNKIPKDASVGFIGDSSSTEYQKLRDAGLKVSDPMSPLDVQGREFDYVVVDEKWNLDLGNSWHNNNINITNFSKKLYTLITRSTKGTILIDKGLSNIIRSAESEFNGEYSGLSTSVQKFRDKRLPEIEKALADNPEVSEQPQEAPTNDQGEGSDEPTTIGGQKVSQEEIQEETTPIKKDGDNSEEETESASEEMKQNTILNSPVTTYSSVSYSGINTAGDIWVNDSNSTSDLGIFIKPGQEVKEDKVELMKRLLELKSLIIYGSEYYDRLPPRTKEIFNRDSFNNIQYFIKVEDESDSNRLIGLTKGSGLSNENRTIRGKVIKLVAKLEGKDGNIYSVSLGGLNNPDTWARNKDSIKEAIKSKIEKGVENSEELQRLYNSYDDIVAKYSTVVDGWVQNNQEFRINPPKFSQYTRLMLLDSSYRLEEANNSQSPYRSKAPIQIESDINIVIDDIPGISSEMRGKPVMFVSSNLLLSPSELKDIYINQTQDPTMPKQVRMIRLDNVGVSFQSLYQKKWVELYNNKVGKCTFTTPMELQPFAIRMYKAMWNYRAGLSRFMERYDAFCRENSLNDEDVNELCQRDNAEFQRQKGDKDNLDEAQYRKLVPPELQSKLQVLWDFNDSLADYVKEFRLGFNSVHGAYLRKLTNIDSKFYDNPDKAVGIYINPQIARTQLAVLENIFNTIVDQIIPPSEQNKKSYITTNLQDVKGWFKNVEATNSIDLDFEEENASTRSTLHISDKTNLTVLPLVMIKAAHYISIQMATGKQDFLDNIREAYDNGSTPYTIKYRDKVLGWMGIIDPIDNQVGADKDAEFSEGTPGVIPYNKENRTGVYDSRMDDLFNLMFHGVISTPVENDFTRDNIRATAAQFKYGIFSDPILVEKKNDQSGQIDRTVTNKKLFSSNAVSSGPLIAVDIKPYVEQNPEKPITQQQQIKVVNPVQDLHNKVAQVLTLAGIEISPTDFDSVEDYIGGVNTEIDIQLRNFIQNNSNIQFENMLTSMSNDGSLTLLKDNEYFQGKTFKSMELIPNAKKITLVNSEGKEEYYSIQYHNGVVVIPYQVEGVHPKTLTQDQAINTITQTVESFFKDKDGEDLEIFNEELTNLFQGGDISWKTFTGIVNTMIGYLKENYGDTSSDVRTNLTNLLKSCPI